MQPIVKEFFFLTSAFPHGAYASKDSTNQPDLRPPSIKGQLRWWFDALYGNKRAEDALFGGLKNATPGGGQGAESSRVVFRLEALTAPRVATVDFMPHKNAYRGSKNAISPGSKYRLTLLPRRDGITDEQAKQIQRILDAWLLLGAIGQRANRAAGSVSTESAPTTAEAYEQRAMELLGNSKLRAAILPESDNLPANDRGIRNVAGDFLESRAFGMKTPFGSARPRVPSMLKLRAVRIDERLKLLALWDGRFIAYPDLERAVATLVRSNKEIGRMLQAVLPKLKI